MHCRTGGGSAPTHAALIPISNGPESLVIDATRRRAYTHLWSGTTVAIDLATRSVVGRGKNLCKDSRGIALGEGGGFHSGCATKDELSYWTSRTKARSSETFRRERRASTSSTTRRSFTTSTSPARGA